MDHSRSMIVAWALRVCHHRDLMRFTKLKVLWDYCARIFPEDSISPANQHKGTRRRVWLQYGIWCFGILLVLTTICTYRVFVTYLQGQKRIPYMDLEMFYVAYPHKYRFIIDQRDVCKQHDPYVVIIVPVAPHDVAARNAIRSTWGNDSLVQDGDVLVMFQLGLPSGSDPEMQQVHIHEENLQHRDLLQSDFIDSYRNLTIKTMVMLEWLRDHCPQAQYAAKVDADMLLNVGALTRMLLSPVRDNRNYITGLVWYDNVVIRDPTSKFYIPHEVYPNNVYPPYPLGMCYIISMDLPEKIMEASRKIKPIFIEDAYIGLCLEKLHIAPAKPLNAAQFVVKPPLVYDRCYYSKLIAVTTDSPAQLISIWTDLQKAGPAC